MNAFRLAGDLCHVLSILVLLLRLKATKNALGISIKTQELYLLVFVCRYLDLFTTFYSLYNSVMKVLYISATAYIIYMVRKTEPFKTTYEHTHDSFVHWQYAVAPCVVLAVITNFLQGFNLMELFWVFSIYLEAVAILPQLFVLQRYGEVENLTANYVFLLGIYRALYILNWIYRSYHETYYRHNWVVYSCGIVQTCLYVDFFYYYFLSKYRGGGLKLPK